MKVGLNGMYLNCWRVHYEWRYTDGHFLQDRDAHFCRELIITNENSIDDVRDSLCEKMSPNRFLHELIEVVWLGDAFLSDETIAAVKGGEG